MSQKSYSSLKLFKYRDQIDSLKSNELKAPIHVRIKPTNACNHHCHFCAYKVDHLQLGENMNTKDQIAPEKMREITRDLISMDVKAVTFSGGGEPLLYPDLISTIENFGEAGVKVAAITNGSFLKGEMAEAFLKYGSWIRVSMDYFDELSLQRSRKTRVGEFLNIIDNIKMFCEKESSCTLGVSFIITKENAHKVFEICSLLKSVGVDHVKLSALVVSNDVAENNLYHCEIEEVVLEQINKCEVLTDKSFKIINHFHRTNENFKKSYSSCPSMKFLTIIGADNTVYSCQDKAYTDSGKLGSIKDRSFKEFWYSNENREKLQGFNPKSNCAHHCVAHKKNQMIHEFMDLDDEHVAFI